MKSRNENGPAVSSNQAANLNTLPCHSTAKPTGRIKPTGTSFDFTGICPCGGRVACYMKGKKPNRTSVSTCAACGSCEVVQE